MVQSIFQGTYLHDYTKIKNLDIPITKNISRSQYPVQKDNVGDIVTIKYRSLCMWDRIHLHAPVGEIIETSSVILRCDNEYPFKVIVLTLDEDDVILVGDSRSFDDGIYIFTHPNQQVYLDNYVHNYYGYSKEDGYRGSVIECDNGEPLQVVIAEYTSDGVLRFVTGDEVISEIILDESEKLNQPDLVSSHSMLDGLQDKRIWF